MDTNRPWQKDPEPFFPRVDDPPGGNLEARLERMIDPATGDLRYLTPTELFFVRNNSRTVEIDPDSYRLHIHGDAVERELNLSLEDLQGMVTQERDALLECAGDHRGLFTLEQGQEVEGDPWMLGAVGLARWTGVRLADVLDRAGLRPGAAHVLLTGLDPESPEGGWRRPLPLDKARAEETLLAFGMNGEPLEADHGFPVRAVVPGWVGASSIKWLGSIEVSSGPFWVRNNTRNYVLIGDDHPPEGEARGRVVTRHALNSTLALPWDAEIDLGEATLQGYAWSPDAPVERVEWRADRLSDDGEVIEAGTWRDAELWDRPVRWAWRRFRFAWAPEASGRWVVRTRAWDADGQSQPDEVAYNEKGYLFNAPVPHPVRVR